ncbi:TPA: serine/threonine-protein kinase [Candidatus Poribacteria bacterium]|nr:serine/threonine-protein kinase [Candidatus Poribacteria bacterium]
MQMCPECSHDNNDTAKFCNVCGAELLGLLGKSEILHSRYRVTKVLGCGGFGAVYLAEDIKQNNTEVAIKVMFDDLNWTAAERDENIENFQEEANILRSLSHLNLPKVFDVFADGGKHYFVMEYIEGQNLKDIIERSTVIGGITESQVIGWTIQICDVLEYLHNEKIIHRDIKPDNIRFTPEGQIKLVDFGIAKIFDPKNPKTATVKRAATHGYSAPEQYSGTEYTDARSDIYSLGATLYYLWLCEDPPAATNRLADPKVFKPPRQVNTAISENMEQVILKAMELRSDDRYQTVAEMKDALLGRVVEEPPVLELSATRLDFGKISIGTTTSRTFDISNIGDGILKGTITSTVPNISISPSNFSISGSDSPVTITVTVTAIRRSGTVTDLTVRSNAGTRKITCEYVVEEPLISVFPTNVEFGTIFRGGKKSQRFTIENNGSGTLSGDVRSDSPCVTVMPDQFQIQKSTRQYIAVTVSDKSTGGRNGNIHITSNAAAKNVAYSYRTLWLSMLQLLCMVFGLVFVGGLVIGVMQLKKETSTQGVVKPTHPVRPRINLPRFQKIGYGGHPNWSPITNKVVFHSNIDGDNEIYVMDPDGSNQQQLTYNDDADFYPEWSPDGQRIAYCSGRRNHYVIKVMNSDGSAIRTLTSSDHVSGLPSWSKDGSKITYHTDRTGLYNIWSMFANGYGQDQVIAQRSSSPHYSPVDDVIVFESKQNNMWDIWAVDWDGSNLRNLTRSTYTCVSPSWSADGSHILYACKKKGEEGIWIMNRDGSNPRLLKHITAKYFGGALSPDGRYLLYTAGDNPENGDMYVFRLDEQL